MSDQSRSFLDRLRGDPEFRSWGVQILVAAGAVLLAYGAFHNVTSNLERQGIASGLDFLTSPAGFEISQTLVPYSEQSTYGQALWVAVLNTLLVSALGILLASVLGLLLGVSRLSHNWLVAKLSTVYVETVRNIPLLLQLFFWYFAALRALPHPRQSLALGDAVFLNIRGLFVPQPVLATGEGWWPFALDYPVLQGFGFQGGMVLMPELVALLLALTIYTAAFIAEIVRAGILAVPNGQSEAAASLGLTRSQTLRLVVIPQAMRVIIPPLSSQYMNLTKNSSLAAAIAYPDLVLVFAGTVLMQTGQAVEVIGITMGIYLALSLSISFGMNLYNRRMALVER